jgi:hypothetical protein
MEEYEGEISNHNTKMTFRLYVACSTNLAIQSISTTKYHTYAYQGNSDPSNNLYSFCCTRSIDIPSILF